MAITSVAQMAAAAKQRIRVRKSYTAQASGTHGHAMGSGFTALGLPGAGTVPAYTAGSGYTCSNTTTGALPLVAAVNTNWLYSIDVDIAAATSTGGGYLVLADRLWHCGGMGFAAGTYTVTTPGSLPARITDGGVGCEIWIGADVGSNAGAPTGSLTVNYLNTVGTPRSSVLSNVSTGYPYTDTTINFTECFKVPLQAGDLGVSQITSVTNGSSWTAGSFGVVIIKPVAAVFVRRSDVPVKFNWAQLGLPSVHNNACLFTMMGQNNQGAGPATSATLEFVDL